MGFFLWFSRELTLKNRTIASMKNKEKEYLSLISSLKFSLEKAKEQAEDCNRCKKELNLVKTKLNEEGKVRYVFPYGGTRRGGQRILEKIIIINEFGIFFRTDNRSIAKES